MKRSLINLGVLLSGLYISSNAANIALVPQTGEMVAPASAPAGADGALKKGKAWPTTRFALDASGKCIIDNLTGLMWVRDLNTIMTGSPKTWDDALAFSHDNRCGYGDWRIPNVNELASLINHGQPNNSNWLNTPIANGGAGFLNVRSHRYWTSSVNVNKSTHAWSIVLGESSNVVSSGKTSKYRVFLVRGGK